MNRLTPLEIANWTALYAATGLCCALAAFFAVAMVGHQLYRERPWQHTPNWRATALLVPQTWWRWQKLYLLSTPVTLGIIGSFALSLSWR